MGRTVPSYRQAIEAEIKRWEGFRKALRAEDREAFDEMMNFCRLYASAGSNATRPVLLEAMLMSIVLAQQKELRKLRKELDEIRRRLDGSK